MVLKSDLLSNNHDNGAVVKQQPSYSAEELAEVLNTSPKTFMALDLRSQTNGWNLDYIYDFLYYIRDIEKIKLIVKMLISKWGRDMNVRGSFTNATDRTLIQKMHDFEDDMIRVEQLVFAKLEQEKADEQLFGQYELLFCNPAETVSQPPLMGDVNQTQIPAFETAEMSNAPQYHLDDLPEDVRNSFLISNDKLYSEFVEIIKGPVKKWIDGHHLKDWNVVRFICRLRGITIRKVSMNIFGLFLEKIGLENQLNNMKQRKDANNDERLNDYDDPRKKQYFWQLKNDGDAIEKELQPIIEQLVA